MSKIDVSNMDLYYGDFHALKNINLSIDANEVTAFIGPSAYVGRMYSGWRVGRIVSKRSSPFCPVK